MNLNKFHAILDIAQKHADRVYLIVLDKLQREREQHARKYGKAAKNA